MLLHPDINKTNLPDQLSWNTEEDDLQLGSPPGSKLGTLWFCGMLRIKVAICCDITDWGVA